MTFCCSLKSGGKKDKDKTKVDSCVDFWTYIYIQTETMRVIGTGGTTDMRQNQTNHQRARLQRLLFRVVSKSLFHLCAGGLGVKTMVRGDCVLLGVFVVWWC